MNNFEGCSHWKQFATTMHIFTERWPEVTWTAETNRNAESAFSESALFPLEDTECATCLFHQGDLRFLVILLIPHRMTSKYTRNDIKIHACHIKARISLLLYEYTWWALNCDARNCTLHKFPVQVIIKSQGSHSFFCSPESLILDLGKLGQWF